MRFLLFLSLVLSSFQSVSLSSEISEMCAESDFICAKSKIDSYVLGDKTSDLDGLIKMLEKMKGNDAYKNNLLGVALMLKEDYASIDKVEERLLHSYNQGIKEAAQNLAELYFLKDDYERCLVFLNKIQNYGYQFPDKKYINWARLYGQILYLSNRDNVTDTEKALEMFSEIKSVDTSGVPEYFLGYHALSTGQLEKGIKLLNESLNYPNEKAAIYLADQYYSGAKLKKNIAEAKKYYGIAAELGSGRALYNLAMISQQEKDVEAMKRYLIRSAKLGYEKAVKLLERARKPKG